MDQKEVDHAGDCVRAIDSRGPIFQDAEVIDHHEGNQVNVHARAKPSGAQSTSCYTFAIYQNQGFIGQQTAQVELDSAVTTIIDVLVDSSARLLRYDVLQIMCVADTHFFDVFLTVCV